MKRQETNDEHADDDHRALHAIAGMEYPSPVCPVCRTVAKMVAERSPRWT